MGDPTRCLFCDHALDGRSTKFCTTCLRPLGQWPSQREYMKQYHILRCAVGIGKEGMERCKIPKWHGAYEHRPLQGPKLSDLLEYGPPKPPPNKYTPDQAEAAIQSEADRLFPRRRTHEPFFVDGRSLFTPKAIAHILTDTGGSSEPLCAACQRPFQRAPGTGDRYSYCEPCALTLRRWRQGGGPELVFVPRGCIECGTMLVPMVGTVGRMKLCSDECRRRRSRRKYHEGKPGDKCDLTPCEDCSTPCRPFKQAQNQSLCNRCRFVKRARHRGKAMGRRIAAEKSGDDITWQELGERDGWVCHLCNGKVKKLGGRAKQPKGATVDHLVPIADGGSHTWDNVALAHRSCNTSRGAGGTAQLRLVG